MKNVGFAVSVVGIGGPLWKSGVSQKKIKVPPKEFFPLTRKSPGLKRKSSTPAKGIRMVAGISRTDQLRIWLRT